LCWAARLGLWQSAEGGWWRHLRVARAELPVEEGIVVRALRGGEERVDLGAREALGVDDVGARLHEAVEVGDGRDGIEGLLGRGVAAVHVVARLRGEGGGGLDGGGLSGKGVGGAARAAAGSAEAGWAGVARAAAARAAVG
jgi:hypothetical protein